MDALMSNVDLPSVDNTTIMIVEDNALVLEHVVELVKSLGYNVIEASDGVQALEKLDQDITVDLLFTDMVMPGGVSGRELAEKAIKKRPDLKVLFTTGFSTDVSHTNNIMDQNVNVLKKPYRRATLIEKLNMALGLQ
ncbi:response regulator [Yoonia sp.]|uniref:response regulator n=1 Tax=Yoonia sp. TaxID=2212373 RepID=UPI002DF7CA7C|nr:response regulator [Yoonia sp.]